MQVRSILSGSVGLNGANHRADVYLVQGLLSAWLIRSGKPPISVDGIAGRETNGAILAFQTDRSTASDSRIDPDGPTIRALRQQHFQGIENQLYFRIDRAPSATGFSTEIPVATADDISQSLRSYARTLAKIYRVDGRPQPRIVRPPAPPPVA